MIGGILAQPAEKYPNMFSQNGIFGQYPYFLPCLVGAMLVIVPLPLVIAYLPETLPNPEQYNCLKRKSGRYCCYVRDKMKES